MDRFCEYSVLLIKKYRITWTTDFYINIGYSNQLNSCTFYVGCGAGAKYIILEDQKGCIRGCEEFE